MREPLPLDMKIGSPPTPRKARTGELTPPGISRRAWRKSAWDFGRLGFGWSATGFAVSDGENSMASARFEQEKISLKRNREETEHVVMTSKDAEKASRMGCQSSSAPWYNTQQERKGPNKM